MALDIISAVAGAVVAVGLGILIYSQRARLTTLRSSAAEGVVTARRRLSRGLDGRYRDSVIAYANTQHLAGHLIPLERVAVRPRFYGLPLPHNPLSDETAIGIEEPLELIPLTPDWPQAMAPYDPEGIPLNRLLRAGQSLALLGLPGSGRSTTLALIALLVARQTDSFQEGGLLNHPRLPLLVHLADIDLSSTKVTDGTDLLTPLFDAADSQLGGLAGPALSAIRNQFESGGAVILADAWDELSTDSRMKIAEWLGLLMSTYPGNQLVVAAAPSGYKPLFDIGLSPAYVMPWASASYHELAQCWAAAWPDIASTPTEVVSEPDADMMRTAIRGNRSRTPLDATLKIWATYARDDPGVGQIGWYRSYVNRSIPARDLRAGLERAGEEWAQFYESDGLTFDVLNRHLDTARNTSPQRSAVSTPDFVFSIMNQVHLITQRANGKVTFTHPVIGAYLAAEALKDKAIQEWLLEDRARNDLIMPFLAQLADLTPYVEARLSEGQTILEHPTLMMASWASEADSKGQWRAEVFKQLTNYFIAPSNYPLTRERTMAALVASRDRNVAFIFRQGLQNPNINVRVLSALGLGALGDPEMLVHLGEALRDPEPLVEAAAALGIGALGTKATVNYLVETLVNGRDLARRAVAEMLASRLTDEGHDILREAMQEPDASTRRAAIYGLQRIGEPWAEEMLDNAQNRDDQWMVRTAATNALELLRNPVDGIPGRPSPPDTSDWLVVWLAERDQAIEPGPRAVSQLIRALQEGDDPIRRAAAEALGALGLTEGVTPLYTALRDHHTTVRDSAFRALARISTVAGHALPGVM